MKTIVAFICTQIFKLDENTYCLEFTYRDICKNFHHKFYPLPNFYCKSKTCYPKLPFKLCPYSSYDELLNYVRIKYQELQEKIPNYDHIFTYKGNPNVLKDVGITNILNVKDIGVPSDVWLSYLYPNAKMYCRYHPYNQLKYCTEQKTELAETFAIRNIDFLKQHLKKRGITII